MKTKICKRFALPFLGIAALSLLAAFPALAGEVKMSSTIGPIDAGIVPALVRAYEKKTGDRVVFEGAGTGATLEKAKTGNFDLVMVHARKLEDQFVKEGFAKISFTASVKSPCASLRFATVERTCLCS